MALLRSTINPPKAFNLKHGVLSEAQELTVEQQAVSRHMAAVVAQSVKEMEGYHFTYHFPNETKEERTKVLFVGKHPPKLPRTSVFDVAMKQPVHVIPGGKIPVYRKYQGLLKAVRKTHNGEE